MRRWRRPPARRGARAPRARGVVAFDVARERVPCHALLQLHDARLALGGDALEVRDAFLRCALDAARPLRLELGGERLFAEPPRLPHELGGVLRVLGDVFFVRRRRRLAANRRARVPPPRLVAHRLELRLGHLGARERVARRAARRLERRLAPRAPLAQRRKRLLPGGRLFGVHRAGDGALDAPQRLLLRRRELARLRTHALQLTRREHQRFVQARRLGVHAVRLRLGEVGAVRQRGFRSLTPQNFLVSARQRRGGASLRRSMSLDAARSDASSAAAASADAFASASADSADATRAAERRASARARAASSAAAASASASARVFCSDAREASSATCARSASRAACACALAAESAVSSAAASFAASAAADSARAASRRASASARADASRRASSSAASRRSATASSAFGCAASSAHFSSAFSNAAARASATRAAATAVSVSARAAAASSSAAANLLAATADSSLDSRSSLCLA